MYQGPKSYGGVGCSNMKNIDIECRYLILYMIEAVKKVNVKNGVLRLIGVNDPLQNKELPPDIGYIQDRWEIIYLCIITSVSLQLILWSHDTAF